MGKKSEIIIGLTGNPNTGKSTLFNTLTGAKQHVGNWTGKTIEKKYGEFVYKNKKIKVVDLPGTYSLTAYTEEETITSEFIFEEKPEVIIQIIDTQNLERNLFMTIQLIELGAPLVLALNMVDLTKKKGTKIDEKKLSSLLNIPVVVIDAKKKLGIEKLLDEITKYSKIKNRPKIKLTYGTEVNDELEKIKNFIKKNEKNAKKDKVDRIALKLLEQDIRIEQKLIKKPYYLELKSLVSNSIEHLKFIFNKEIYNILANIRYGFIKGLCKEILNEDESNNKKNFSDKMDALVTNKFLGIPIFLLIAWIMFQSTFTLSKPLINLVETALEAVKTNAFGLLKSLQAPEWIISLTTEGIIGGVGAILAFVPIIGILFLIMAILEDSGYMARVAYVMDKLMHRIGLHGKSFIPLVLGFGCNVPGIMATRTLETKKDRLLTMLMTPFMSCSARLPVYALFAGAFFSAYQGWVIFSMYFIGVFLAIIIGLTFKKIFSKKLSSPFVIEFPPYRWPVITGLLIHSWTKVWIFIKKAGTIILAFSIIIWALASFPTGVEYGSQESFAGHLGETIAPVFEPLGFGNWQASVALIFGSIAKEVVVSTFGTLYGTEDIKNASSTPSLTAAIQNNFTPLSAYAFMVFVLLYVPCVASLATIKRETNSWKWPGIMILYTTTIAWIMAFLVYQGGKLLGFT